MAKSDFFVKLTLAHYAKQTKYAVRLTFPTRRVLIFTKNAKLALLAFHENGPSQTLIYEANQKHFPDLLK